MHQAEQKRLLDLENVTVEKFFFDTYLPRIKTLIKRPDQLHDDTNFKLWMGPKTNKQSGYFNTPTLHAPKVTVSTPPGGSAMMA